jgi:hypothetical protein
MDERVRRSSRWRCICLSAVVRPGRRGRSLLLATRCDRAERVLRRGRARLAHSVCAHEHVGLAVRGRADHGPPAAPTQRSRHVRASTPPVSLPFSSQYPSAPTPNVLQCHRAALTELRRRLKKCARRSFGRRSHRCCTADRRPAKYTRGGQVEAARCRPCRQRTDASAAAVGRYRSGRHRATPHCVA